MEVLLSVEEGKFIQSDSGQLYEADGRGDFEQLVRWQFAYPEDIALPATILHLR